MRYTWRWLALAVLAGLLVSLPANAVGPDEKDVKDVRDKAIAFLRKQQKKDGGFAPKFGPGVTALVIAALVRNDVAVEDDMLKNALGYLSKKVNKDGGIYDQGLQNYTTCVAIMAFKEANVAGKYDTILKNASEFLRKLQFDDPANDGFKFGGLGYNERKERPDLSNTQFFVEAMIAAGVPKDDPALKRALQFVSRCQNFADKEKGNDLSFAAKAKEEDKGGFVYVNDPDDKKHLTPEGGLRSQGAMTYAGLKSFLYAGVKKDDPRVKSALRWVRANYTLEENPGQGQNGLFYYYHTFSKAMEALGEDEFKDAKDVSHDWRKDLFKALQKRQGSNGGFVNVNDKAFGEKDGSLATAFALLSLSYTPKK